MTISNRAQNALRDPSPLVVAHFESAKDAYHPDKNPKGAINLGTAENYLMGQEMLAWLKEVKPLTEHALHYADFRGIAPLREVLATFLREVTGIPDAKAEHIVIGNGVSSLLESLAFSLFDPGDGLIVPAPCYTGYQEDFKHRFGVNIIPAPMPCENQFDLDVDVLQQTYAQAVQQGERVKAILINNPNNPLGKHYTRAQLEAVVEFAMAHRLQIIADEIYAHSIFDSCHGPFESLLTIGAHYQENIHVLYGLAKDFGLSGFKFAFYYSENEDAVKAMASNAYFYNVSTLLQHTVETLFSDISRIRVFLGTYNKKLTQAHKDVLQINEQTIAAPVLSAQGGHFVFINLVKYLSASTFEAEMQLFHRIWSEAKVNITPGQFFHCPYPGWFRVCFAAPREQVEQSFIRLNRLMLS